MGQILQHLTDPELLKNQQHKYQLTSFPDLNHLPPELATIVLSNLNATDLCLASCVWSDLASTEILWHGYAILFIFATFYYYFLFCIDNHQDP